MALILAQSGYMSKRQQKQAKCFICLLSPKCTLAHPFCVIGHTTTQTPFLYELTRQRKHATMLSQCCRNLIGEGNPTVQISSKPSKQGHVTRSYHTIDVGGWLILLALAGVFIATGVTIRLALRASQHPLLGDFALVVGVLIALLWAALYGILRVSTRVVLSDSGLMLTHGPWRHSIAWQEVERVSEWSAVEDGVRSHWLAIWSIDGMRLQVRQDLIGNFSAFRTDVMRSLSLYQDTPDAITDLETPLVMSEGVSGTAAAWTILGTIISISGGLVIDFLPEVRLFGIAVATLGGLCLVMALTVIIFKQTIFIMPAGVTSRRGIFNRQIAWSGIYGLERAPAKTSGNVWGILGRGVVMVVFRIDNRSGVVPGPVKSHSTITIVGGAGQAIRIHEKRYLHPNWLRARLRAEIAALRTKAAPLVPKVTPLAPSGPLAPGTVLPPDPMDGSSTLWLRESSENDPFRAAHNNVPGPISHR